MFLLFPQSKGLTGKDVYFSVPIEREQVAFFSAALYCLKLSVNFTIFSHFSFPNGIKSCKYTAVGPLLAHRVDYYGKN